MPDFAVTGANGFVGSRLCELLVNSGSTVRSCIRPGRPNDKCAVIEVAAIEDFCDAAEWARSFENVDCVVHLLARVHRPDNQARDALAEYRRTNVEGSVAALQGAARSGVRRFVFLSSIKVNGEAASVASPFLASDTPEPLDAYAVSKWEAEQRLRRESVVLGVELVILRPVLVYGPGVRANFLRLLRLVSSGVPLPLGAIENLRSLLYLDNLCDLIRVSARHSAAAGETFLVSDGAPVSTPELLRRIAFHMGRSSRVFPAPRGLLSAFGRVLGRTAELDRLCGSLVADTAKTQELLGWSPPLSTDAGLRETVRWFIHERAP